MILFMRKTDWLKFAELMNKGLFLLCPPPLSGRTLFAPPEARAMFYIMIYYVMARLCDGRQNLKQMVKQSILTPVQPGVRNATPVVWRRKKSGERELGVTLKVLINGKVMDEDYPIPDMETIFHNLHGPSHFVKIRPLRRLLSDGT